MENILITGGKGFIGRHLAIRLMSMNYNLIIIDDESNSMDLELIPRAKYIKEDISKIDFISLFDQYKFKYVFHLAAQVNLRHSIHDPKQDANTNILGTINLLRSCVKYNSKLIYSSTGGAIYDEQSCLPWTEDTLVNPKSPYGLSKWASEKYIELYHKLHNLDYIILRYSNVYGPNQNHSGEAGVISIFVNNINNNVNLKIFGDGKQTRDFVYVSDVVDANIAAMNLNDICSIFNVCSNTETSIISIAEELIKISDSNVKIDLLPKNDGECIRTKLSFDKFNKATLWQPKVTLTEGINNIWKTI